MIAPHDITGLILAGGRSARMGHVDKGLQPFRTLPMVQHVIQRLQPQTGCLMINANQHQEAYQAFQLPVWPDQIQDFSGPLAGMQTGLMHCETPYMMIVPCDAPFLPDNLVQCLAHALYSDNADAAVAQTVADGRRQLQPVFCLLKRSLSPSLTRFLQDGGRKVEAWLATQKIVRVDFADVDAFRNINAPEDVRKFDSA